MANDAVYADLLDALSPLKSAGIDPDEARVDPQAAMAKLNGPEPEKPWYMAQNDAPQQPGASPNGNPLPPGLQSRTSAPAEPAAVPATVTPTGDPKTLAGSNTGTINLMQQDYARASQDVQNEARQPDLSTVTAPLEQQRVNAQRRQVELDNPYDPKTGKLLDEYKPSFGQRLMRGVEGFARGGVLGAVNPGMTGSAAYGAPNKFLGIDQQQAAGRVAGADQQLKQAADAWKSTNERLKQIATERRALATTGKDVTGAADAQQKLPIEQQKADTEDARAATAQQLADQKDPDAQFAALRKQADTMRLKGQQRTLFLANGKLPDPKQASAGEIMVAQATAAWHRDHPNQQPKLEDIRQIHEAALGREDKVTTGGTLSPALKNKILDEKKASMDVATGALRDGRDKSGQEYSQQDWQRDMQAAQDKFEAAIESAGGTTDHMTVSPDGSWTAESASQKKPAAAQAAQPVAQPKPAGPKGASLPPASLLKSTAEGGDVYGKKGEHFKKVKGQWQEVKQ